MLRVDIEPNFDSWRQVARKLLRSGIAPDQVLWNDGSEPTLDQLTQPFEDFSDPSAGATTVTKDFIPLARTVSLHRDVNRWPLLYRTLFRLTHEQPHLLEISIDDDVRKLYEMEKSVRRDIHKMHAFVRFRKVEREDGEWFIAFHRPDHLIMPVAAPWFARRFAVMNWTILTPDASATWDTNDLQFGPGVAASMVASDELEDLWRTYYANIFNPARIKIGAMKKEMAVRHWRTMPETQIIDDLLREAPTRVKQMIKHTAPKNDCEPKAASAAEFIPQSRSLTVLHKAIQSCKGCDLYCNATQAVFGQGPSDAVAMFVGEQPGDQEDLAGKPFVGPAGQLLDQALEEVGIDRSLCYVTNTVKHFKFEQRGKRRIHAKPSAREVAACKPWLAIEMEIIKPKMIIALGATAAQAIMGPQIRITRDHGRVVSDHPWAPWLMATIHPSALLRIPDPALKEKSHAEFLDDLHIAAKQIRSHCK